jgi:hypothetical protein
MLGTGSVASTSIQVFGDVSFRQPVTLTIATFGDGICCMAISVRKIAKLFMVGMIVPVCSNRRPAPARWRHAAVRTVYRQRIVLSALVVLTATTGFDRAHAHDLEGTQVSLTFARDASFVLDVTNDLNWLTLRLQPFAGGRRDLGALGEVFRDRVVLFVDGREVRPVSAEFLPPVSSSASGDGPLMATYRLRGRVPAGARTLRWYYGLVIDPYPLALHRADGRTITETVYGDAWSRALDISGQFDRHGIPAPVARQLPIVIMVGVLALALGYRLARNQRSVEPVPAGRNF